MPPILLLASLAAAHADEDGAHHHRVAEPSARAVGDLAVEGAFRRLGLQREDARQVSTHWMPAVAAPERSRREGREDGWGFDVDRIWITERSMSTGVVVSEHRAAATWSHPLPCAALDADEDSPLVLTPLDPPLRSRGVGERSLQEQRLDLTVAKDGDSRRILFDLGAGESALLVELLPPGDAKPRRRARRTRHLRIDGRRAAIDLYEGQDSNQVCVEMRPVLIETAAVFIDRKALEAHVRARRERQRTATDGLAQSESE